MGNGIFYIIGQVLGILAVITGFISYQMKFTSLYLSFQRSKLFMLIIYHKYCTVCLSY